MIIQKNRIRSLNQYTKKFKSGDKIKICIPLDKEMEERAWEAGFSKNLEVGESVLPTQVGTITKFNAQGKFIPQKDKEMETAYRQAEWTWKQYRGRYDFEEKSKIVEIPYERYPRKFTPPPSVELSIDEDNSKEKVVSSPEYVLTTQNEELIVHTINVFLEIFGEAELRDNTLNPTIPGNVIRLNWDVLPPGKRPWSKLKPLLKEVSATKKSNQVVIDRRFEEINSYEPEFTAVGRAGFSGYVIFGFPKKNLYVLESNEVNNATYIFDKDWESLSQLTKAEVLDNELQKDRVIHRKTWFNQIHTLLK